MAAKEVHFQTTIKLRRAVAEDFRVDYGELADDGVSITMKVKPKLGQCYWLRSGLMGDFSNHHYIIDEETNWDEFRAYMKQGMVFVPVNDAWISDYEHRESLKITG